MPISDILAQVTEQPIREEQSIRASHFYAMHDGAPRPGGCCSQGTLADIELCRRRLRGKAHNSCIANSVDREDLARRAFGILTEWVRRGLG